jgi:hypothetical protein
MDTFLVMAVNRFGFLVLGYAENSDTDIMLYKVSGNSLWDLYTAESFFVFKGKPAVLLYRNDFFNETSAPPISPQVYTLDFFNPAPISVNVPVLENFPSSGPWEAELLRRGPDGYWYFRMKEKGERQNETAYFRSQNLSDGAEKVSVDGWRKSNSPENLENAPSNLAAILNLAEEGSRAGALRVISPAFEGQRFFSTKNYNANESSAPLNGFYRNSFESLALAVHPDGKGFYSYGTGQEVVNFSLSALPVGFIYTGLAILGKVLVASWEEQQEAGIGAAGFMVQALDSIVK